MTKKNYYEFTDIGLLIPFKSIAVVTIPRFEGIIIYFINGEEKKVRCEYPESCKFYDEYKKYLTK